MSKSYPEHLSPELLACIEAVVGGTASAEQIHQLEDLLADSEAARSLYLDYTDLHAELRRRLLNPAEEIPGDNLRDFAELAATPTEAPTESLQARVGWLPALALAAGLLVVVALGGLWSVPADSGAKPSVAAGGVGKNMEADSQLPEEQRASLNGVAVLTKTVGVRWSPGSAQYQSGSPLPLGELSIDAGLLQVEFYCGAVAVLEGPASFDLRAGDRVYLKSGKVRAKVPTQARGFTIMTRSGDVVDLGTEFAIDISRSDALPELHVIDGEVRFHPMKAVDVPPRHLVAGQALQLNDQTTMGDVLDAVAERFIGSAELEFLSRKQAESSFHEFQTYRDKLLDDPALIASYAYSPAPVWSRLFRNHAPGASNISHGAVVGCDWAPGRWPGQKALRFRNASHRVCINLPGEYDSLTLSTWVAFDKLHPTNKVALMHPDLDQPRVLHWTVDRGPQEATLHFSETPVTADESSRVHYGSGKHAVFESDIGQWIHLATVYDADRRLVSHYRNGRLIASRPIKSVHKLSIGLANLGNWPYKDWAKGTKYETRNLNGRMDEFVALGRAMSDAEIAEMHQAGRP